MDGSKPRRGRTKLYLGFAGLAVLVALAGFSRTFFLPLFAGGFEAQPIVYAHGLLLYGWVALFLVQTLLVHRRRTGLHRTLGWWGAGLGLGVVLSTLAVAHLAARRVLGQAGPDQASGELLVVIIEMAMFSALLVAAILQRARPDTHKRLMLLALIGLLGPAWFRFRHFFPPVENPLFLYSIVLADSLILIAAAWDWLVTRRLHPIWPLVGGLMVAIHCFEVFGFGTPPYQTLANLLARPWL